MRRLLIALLAIGLVTACKDANQKAYEAWQQTPAGIGARIDAERHFCEAMAGTGRACSATTVDSLARSLGCMGTPPTSDPACHAQDP